LYGAHRSECLLLMTWGEVYTGCPFSRFIQNPYRYSYANTTPVPPLNKKQ